MAKSHLQKVDLLDKYKHIIQNKKGYLLVNSDKVNASDVAKLKIQLKEANADYAVLKNTVFKIALQETNQPLQTQEVDGPTAIIYFDEDPTSPAKLIKQIQKEKGLLSAKFGVFENEFLSSERVMELADIPSRDVLLSRLAGSMNASLTGFMNTITGNIKGLTLVLKGISEKSA
ncbi:MAG TPA: 50S ribosomal protein L10 [Candidatus Dojkabacteria bacterium]|jgi:large subunit ribosomal protein L10|nr:50S ribosomal protein L10 [Candidatus Dojkabacteria bacterium]